MYQNQMNMGNPGSPMPAQNQGFKLEIPQENRAFYLGVLAGVITIIVGCFLPFLKYGPQSVNYIYNQGELADGIFLIILGIVAVLILLWKKLTIVALICQGISAVLFVSKWLDIKDAIKITNSYSAFGGYKTTYGIGFWVILIGIVFSIVCLVMLLVKAKKNSSTPQAVGTSAQGVSPVMPQPMQPQVPVQPQPVVQNNCPYCGTPKNNGSAFCSNCGAKF